MSTTLWRRREQAQGGGTELVAALVCRTSIIGVCHAVPTTLDVARHLSISTQSVTASLTAPLLFEGPTNKNVDRAQAKQSKRAGEFPS